MRVSFLRFGVLVSILGVVRATVSHIHDHTTELEPLSLALFHLTDPESLLATGQKLPLACADVASLELISGVSDRLALELIESYPKMHKAVAGGVSEEIALKLAHGVGESKAKTLAHFISISESCTQNIRFERFEPMQ